MPKPDVKRMLSEQVYDRLKAAVLSGDLAPGAALKPQELASAYAVSLAVVREALVRLVGEGLAERLPNRGFALPQFADERWQQIAEARTAVEPAMLRLSVARGDLEWETRVRAASHRLARTPMEAGDGPYYSEAWAEAHRRFHRTLLEACDNRFLLETFDRMWTASELARRYSVERANPAEPEIVSAHQLLEDVALSRDVFASERLLAEHLSRTAATLSRRT